MTAPGDAARPDWIPFDTVVICPACTCPSMTAQHCDRVHGVDPAIRSAPDPHLHRTCKACGYELLQYCANDERGHSGTVTCSFCSRTVDALTDEYGADQIGMIGGPHAKICTICADRGLSSFRAHQRSQHGIDGSAPSDGAAKH